MPIFAPSTRVEDGSARARAHRFGEARHGLVRRGGAERPLPQDVGRRRGRSEEGREKLRGARVVQRAAVAAAHGDERPVVGGSSTRVEEAALPRRASREDDTARHVLQRLKPMSTPRLIVFQMNPNGAKNATAVRARPDVMHA